MFGVFDGFPVDNLFLSYGAGVQSTAILALCEANRLPRPTAAIFADTMSEPQWVYDYIEYARSMTDIPIITVQKGDLTEAVLGMDFVGIPAFYEKDGKSQISARQCTRDYKIRPLVAKQRELSTGHITTMLGISLDEITRCKDSLFQDITNYYPLIDLKLTRTGCVKILEELGWNIPKKSSCVFCPFHSDLYWEQLKRDYPEEFAKAVEIDKSLREREASYLHRSLKPLESVTFKGFKNLFDFECDGHCGI